MSDIFQTLWDTSVRVFVVGGMVIGPIAVFLYLVIAHGALFFSPKGRLSRLSFWEGLSAWALFNAFGLIYTIMYMMYSANFLIRTLADKTQSDGDFTIYTNLFYAIFILLWIFSLATLVPICAKRWHDLNLPGALAAINAAPVLVVGLVILVFFGRIGQVLFQHLITDSSAFGPGVNVFNMLDQAKGLYFKEYINAHSAYYYFIAEITVGSFLYLGLAPSTDQGGGNRKKSVSASPRASRA